MPTWQNEGVLLLRHLIGDIDTPTMYNDARLEQVLVASAQLNSMTIDFTQTYSIELDQCYISPDPTDSPKDNAFINLMCLKAACLILSSEAKIYANQSFSIKDGPSSVSTGDRFKNTQERAKWMCEAFEQAVLEYKAGSSAAGAAIISSYVSEMTPTQPFNFR